ncbi:uncharacterized protein OCT59_015499 [Rhizophagus irregularis]|uniref:uncharacterized protein n=1 Tax=Rhizophagus irregularis TaxID=588596 RepID=UPI000CB77A20|nr:hypothetical protein OCT59_015499 [Rhizophagus irregularis]GBC18576.1 hypothetical protein GLOIN_2v1775596 [Rhizophagus irregularis DAOM 181602=DAOM 197198]
MQNSEYTKNLSIPIPQNILIGKLIGREGRNIKPIAERTGTHIYVDTNKIPAQIKIYVNNKKEIPPFENRINDASSQLNDLLNKISQQENKKVDKIKKKKELSLFENRINDASNQLNDSTKQISKQENKKIDKIKKKKEISLFENRINDASNQLNDSTKQISKQENKKIDKINKKKEIFLFENRINDASNRLNDSTKQISKQGIDNINKKKEVLLFENRIGQLNDLINGFPKQKNKKIDKDKKGKKKEKKKKDKKVLKKVEFERPSKEVEFERISKEVQHKSQELKKTLTKFVDNKVAKVADVAVVNDDLPEKFSRFSKNFKRKCKNKPKHKKMPDGMCWNGVDCRRKFCQFEHPSVRQYYNRYLILRYKKEIYSRKHKRDFKKESRLYIKNYKIED